MASALALAGCTKSAAEKTASVPVASAVVTGALPRYSCEVIAAWPHDRGAFTQGLVFRNGGFLESTGMHGQSNVRAVELKTGRILKQVSIAQEYFGEGLTVIGERAYQLTWQHGKGFVYDADTFRLEREFTYAGEGWGLATDGRSLILSDGTSRIRFLDPATFQVTRTIDVTMNGKPRNQLNELEWIRGEIFANVWQTDEIVRIDAITGQVRGVIDCAGLLTPQERSPGTDVLNGIAYDAATDRLFLTGKYWPNIFEVRLVTR
ncbi:MAG: glutaminyl-peptide cyclotransferase [Opitutus sp.]|nr:glutaminyl-peptide cyclotransferase [Opitutus sp.]